MKWKRLPMKMSLALASLAVVLCLGLLPRPVCPAPIPSGPSPSPTSPGILSAGILADTINSVVNGISWSGDAQTISVGTIFGKASTSAFDSATATTPAQTVYLREIASEDGYTSQTIDGKVRNMMSSIGMTGALPVTYTENSQNIWLVYDRSMIPLYTDFQGWNKQAALAQLQADLQANGGPLLGFGQNGGWNYAERYYDEWIEDLDIFLKMGDTATAASLWSGVNDNNWRGSYYCYRPDHPDTMECEVGFFAAVVGNYMETVGTIPNFDRVSTDLYTKLLANGWNSPLWGSPSAMQHATTNPQLRLENTLAGIEALDMYYSVSSSAYRSAFVNLLTGGTPAWQQFLTSLSTSGLWQTGDVDLGAEKAALLFLYGVIPDSGSLAIPTNEWHYEDWTSMMPSTLFQFNYNSHTIRIPVYAGNIKFDFGSSIASYNFPQNGVYQVQFSSDWNTVTSASVIEGLTRFHFLNGGSVTPPPSGYGSIQVTGTSNGQPVTFEAWYDSASHITASSSGYTFTNVPSGSHTVYGLYNGVQKSSSVTVSARQTATCTFDFSASQSSTIRPSWWPSPLPWPLPAGFLSTIVSSPLYTFAGIAVSLVAVIGVAAKLAKPKTGTRSIGRR